MTAATLCLSQKEFFLSGATRPLEFRLQQCEALKRAVLEYEDKIIEAVAEDMGRPAHETYPSEILLVLNEIDHAARSLHRQVRPKRVKSSMMHRPGKSYVLPEPYGNVLIMGPWNYPFQLLLGPLVGAIAAGNTAVLKMSEIAEHSARTLAEMIARTFEPTYIAAVEGGVAETEDLLSQPFDYIFFTGSVAVGRVVMERAAANLTPVTLELGGKNPCIVTPDTRLDTAARRICWGKFFNAGQTCVAPDYVLVQTSIRDQLLTALETAITEFYGKEPQASADFGRIINDRHFDRLCGLMENQTVAFGGQSERSRRFIAPTLLVDVEADSPIMVEEVFGPLLPVLTYSSLDDALESIRRRPKPLSLYLFSDDKSTQERVLRETSSGSVNINETLSQVASTALPFGGVGESGMGRYHGEESFRTFSHYKSIMHRSIRFDARMKYPPFRTPLERLKRIMRLIS